MTTMQIRNVPEDVRSILKARAAAAGQSLSEYALAQLTRSARRPTVSELSERVRIRGGASPSTPAAEILRDERDIDANR